MRALLTGALALLATVLAPQADAQLPPLQQQWLRESSPPIQQAPLPPLTQPNGRQSPSGPLPNGQVPGAQPTMQPPVTQDFRTQPQNQPPQPAQASSWQPAGTVRLQALDKVNAQSAALTIKVGGSATFGSLTITAKACVVRPKDQPADAAAFLAVTDSHPDSPGFDGWMLEAEPSVSMLQHPLYDLRVLGCT